MTDSNSSDIMLAQRIMDSWCCTSKQRNCSTWLDRGNFDAFVDAKILRDISIILLEMFISSIAPLDEFFLSSVSNELSNAAH